MEKTYTVVLDLELVQGPCPSDENSIEALSQKVNKTQSMALSPVLLIEIPCCRFIFRDIFSDY